MTRYVDVTHAEWLAAPVETVRTQVADLDPHIHRNVHPKLRFEVPERRQHEGRAGTVATISIRLPPPPLIGRLVRPLLETQIRKELRAAALEDKADMEAHGCTARAAAAIGPVAPA